MNDDKIRISPDALIAMIVTEAQDRELARMPSLEEMNEDFQPSEKFQRKMEALVRDTKRKAEREKRLLNVKRFFITLTAAISIFSCTMLPVKAVREAVITTLIHLSCLLYLPVPAAFRKDKDQGMPSQRTYCAKSDFYP